MLSRIPALILAALVVPLTVCAPAGEELEPAVEEAPTTQADVAAIKGRREEYNAAVEDADVARVMALLTAEAVLMPPNEPAVAGTEAIRSWYEGFFEQFTVELTSSAEEVEVADDWAFERGTYSMTLTPKVGGEPVADSGKLMSIFRRQTDGSWKADRGIWNSDNPPLGTGQ